MIFGNLSRIREKLQSPSVSLGLFTLLGLIALSQHAFWRDEMNPWLIARDSTNWADLFQNVRYEGHPILWYLCLVILNWITDSPVSMQLLHLSIGLSAVTLFWFYSPFKPLEKLLFTFGYFPFYEYLVISRNYAFGVLGSFLFCTLLPHRKSSYIPFAIVLGLMANSHAYAFFIAVFFSLTLLLELILDSEHRRHYFQATNSFDLIASLVIFLGTFAFALYTILPPGDSQLHGGGSFFLDFDFHRLLWSIGRISGAYLLIIPKSSSWFDLIFLDTLVLSVVGLIALKFLHKPFVLFFYLISTISITFIFFYGKYLGGFRHFGGLYFVLISSLWMAHHYRESLWLSQTIKLPSRLISLGKKIFPWVFLVILLMHLVTGLVSITREVFIPWSGSRAAAEYIEQTGLNHEFIVASRDSHMAPLAGYLNRKFYYPEMQSLGSFTLFLKSRQIVEQPMVMGQVSEILTGDRQVENLTNERILLILNSVLELNQANNLFPNLKITPIEKFERSYIHDEKYYLYWVALNR